MDDLTEENFLLFAAKHYWPVHYSIAEFNSDLKRITYRAGFRFEKTGIIVNNQSINERAVNLGLAFPITGSFSTLS